MINNKLIQTRVNEATYAWVLKKSEEEGLSIASWLRNHLLHAKWDEEHPPDEGRRKLKAIDDLIDLGG